MREEVYFIQHDGKAASTLFVTRDSGPLYRVSAEAVMAFIESPLGGKRKQDDQPIDSLRPEVLWFAYEMEKQLRAHDKSKGKDGWKSLTFLELYGLLDDEREELSTAFMSDRGCYDRMIHEAADLANIAMMIADNARIRQAFEVGAIP